MSADRKHFIPGTSIAYSCNEERQALEDSLQLHGASEYPQQHGITTYPAEALHDLRDPEGAGTCVLVRPGGDQGEHGHPRTVAEGEEQHSCGESR